MNIRMPIAKETGFTQRTSTITQVVGLRRDGESCINFTDQGWGISFLL
jgi:hypothetical protein